MKYRFSAVYTDGHVEKLEFSQDGLDAAWAYAVGFFVGDIKTEHGHIKEIIFHGRYQAGSPWNA